MLLEKEFKLRAVVALPMLAEEGQNHEEGGSSLRRGHGCGIYLENEGEPYSYGIRQRREPPVLLLSEETACNNYRIRLPASVSKGGLYTLAHFIGKPSKRPI